MTGLGRDFVERRYSRRRFLQMGGAGLPAGCASRGPGSGRAIQGLTRPQACARRRRKPKWEHIGDRVGPEIPALGMLYLPLLQLLAYHRAVHQGVNPDESHNLTSYVELSEG